MNLFYSEDINENNKQIFLRDQEHRHLVKSLRFDINEKVFVVDGKGNKYETKLVEKGRNTSKLEILNKFTFSEKKSVLSIAISPTKKATSYQLATPWMDQCRILFPQDLSFFSSDQLFIINKQILARSNALDGVPI